jgi:hypothetical protein
VSNLILPYQSLEPKATGVLADRLEQALARLPQFGIAVPPAGRLPQTVKLLRSIHQANAYPATDPELVRVGNAVKAAFNFVRFLGSIQPPGPPGVLESVKRALKGKLDDVGPTEAHRAQSELLVGVTLVGGGVRVGAPRPGKGKTPDYVAEVDTVSYSTEVKRPGSAGAIERAVADAVRQVRAYKAYPSVVALDFSDLSSSSSVIRDVRAAEAQYEGTFRAAYTTARDYLVRRRADHGYGRVALLFCFAESFLWAVPQASPIPHSAMMMYVEVFLEASAGLIVDQSRKLRRQIVAGFEDLGGRVRRLDRVP